MIKLMIEIACDHSGGCAETAHTTAAPRLFATSGMQLQPPCLQFDTLVPDLPEGWTSMGDVAWCPAHRPSWMKK